MNARLKFFVKLLIRTFREWRRDNGSLMAAGLAFFTIFSLVPIIMVTIAIVARVFERSRAKDLVIRQVETVSSPEMAQAIRALLEYADKAAGPVSLIGGLLVLWAASRIFAQLQIALNAVWQSTTSKARGFRKLVGKAFYRLRALSMTVALGAVLVIFFVLDVGLAALQELLSQYFPLALVRYVWPAASFALSLALFAIVFSLIYKWLPEAPIRWKDAWAGGIFSSFLFGIGRYLISLYFHYTDVGSPFGVAGSVIVVLMWIYFSMEILLLGAEFTWVYAHRHSLLHAEIKNHSRNG